MSVEVLLLSKALNIKNIIYYSNQFLNFSHFIHKISKIKSQHIPQDIVV